jgi:hypothetical protein
VCELSAPIEVLKARFTARGPNTHWQEKLVGFVELFIAETISAACETFRSSPMADP